MMALVFQAFLPFLEALGRSEREWRNPRIRYCCFHQDEGSECQERRFFLPQWPLDSLRTFPCVFLRKLFCFYLRFCHLSLSSILVSEILFLSHFLTQPLHLFLFLFLLVRLLKSPSVSYQTHPCPVFQLTHMCLCLRLIHFICFQIC